MTASVEQVTDLLNSYSLASSFDTSNLEEEANGIKQVVQKVEKVFQSFTPEEINLMENGGQETDQLTESSEYKRRQRVSEYCPKLQLRQAMFDAAVSISFCGAWQQGDDSTIVSQKSKFLYMRLLNLIIKLDHLPNEDTGDQYLQLNTDLRIQQKIEAF